jgi:tetratricopeptide (TPR) repeat protein
MHHWTFLGLASIGILAAFPLQAQPTQLSPAQVLQEIWQAYQQLDYNRVETLSRQALTHYQQYTPAQLVELHTVLALVLMARNEPSEARQHFEAALSLNPQLELDPILASPKVRDFFEQIRQEMNTQASTPTALSWRYVVQPDPRPKAALRSLVFPGWGQRYKGQTQKGWFLSTLWSLLVGSSLVAHLEYKWAWTAYLEETNPSRIEDHYRTANHWFKTRNNLLLATGVVWLYGYLDALISPPTAASSTQRLQVIPQVNGMELRWSF